MTGFAVRPVSCEGSSAPSAARTFPLGSSTGLLPPELSDDNPYGLPRRTDGIRGPSHLNGAGCQTDMAAFGHLPGQGPRRPMPGGG
ncbi:hypothetical protein GCM10010433_62710 [Streptomyces pulveraceus]